MDLQQLIDLNDQDIERNLVRNMMSGQSNPQESKRIISLGLLKLYFQDKGIELRLYPVYTPGDTSLFSENGLSYNLEILTKKGDLIPGVSPMPTQSQEKIDYFSSKSNNGVLNVKYQNRSYVVPIKVSSAIFQERVFKKMILGRPYLIE